MDVYLDRIDRSVNYVGEIYQKGLMRLGFLGIEISQEEIELYQFQVTLNLFYKRKAVEVYLRGL